MLKNDRYEEIKIIISEIWEDYHLSSLPINIFKLVKDMGFKIAKFSDLDEIIANKILEIESGIDGFSFYSLELQTCIIVINDINNSIKRQRFTIAHELGHIFLSHKYCSNVNEEEANYFASYLLSPSCFCFNKKIYCFIDDPNTIMDIFDISYDASRATISRMNKRFAFSNVLKDYEKVILDSIESIK